MPVDPPPTSNRLAADLLRDAQRAERRGDRGRAIVQYESAIRAAPGEGALSELLEALRGRIRTLYQLEDYATAEDNAHLMHEIAARTGHVSAAAHATNLLGNILYLQHRFPEANTRYDEALQLAYEAGDGVLIGMACQNRGVLASIVGDLMGARECYLECVAAALRTEDYPLLMRAYNNLGMVCADLKEYSQSLLYFDRGIELAKRLKDDTMLAPLKVNRAEPLICIDRLDAAGQTLAEAEQIASRVGDHTVLASIQRFRSAIARIRGDFDLSRQHLDEAIAVAEEHDLALEHAEALGGYSRLYRAEGNIPEAHRALEEAMSRFRELGAAREIRMLEEVREAMEGEAQELEVGRNRE